MEAEDLEAEGLAEAVVGWVVERREWEEGWEAEVADLVEAGAGWAEAGSEAADSVADLVEEAGGLAAAVGVAEVLFLEVVGR